MSGFRNTDLDITPKKGRKGKNKRTRSPTPDEVTDSPLIVAHRQKKKKTTEPANYSAKEENKTNKELFEAALPDLEKERDAWIKAEQAADRPILAHAITEGVLIANMRDKTDNGPCLAGYLNLFSCAQFSDIREVLEPEIDAMIELEKENYGVPLPASKPGRQATSSKLAKQVAQELKQKQKQTEGSDSLISPSGEPVPSSAATAAGPASSAAEVGAKKVAQPQSEPSARAVTQGVTAKFVFKIRDFLQLLARGTMTSADITSTAPPNPANFPTDGSSYLIAHLQHARFFHKAIMCLNTDSMKNTLGVTVLTGPSEVAFSHPYLADSLHWEAEDINRVATMLSYFKRKVSKDLGKKSYHKLPRLPVWGGSRTTTTNSAEQEARQADYMRQLLTSDGSGVTDLTGDALVAVFEQGKAMGEDEAADRLDKEISATRTRLRDDLDVLGEEQLKNLIKVCTANITTLSDGLSHVDDSFFDWLPGAKDTHMDKARAIDKAGTALALTETAHDEDLNKRAAAGEARLAAFQELQRSIASIGATPPDFFDAVKADGMSYIPNRPSLDQPFTTAFYDLALHPWQVQGAVWMNSMLETPLGAAVLGDDVGLGKTYMSLVTIVMQAKETTKRMEEYQRKLTKVCDEYRTGEGGYGKDATNEAIVKAENLEPELPALIGPEPFHRPVLVVAPPSALTAWLTDYRNGFSVADSPRQCIMRTSCALGGSKSSNQERAMAIKGGKEGLKAYLKTLRPKNEFTSRTIILTTYQTWQGYFLAKDKVEIPKSLPAPDGDDTDDEDDDLLGGMDDDLPDPDETQTSGDAGDQGVPTDVQLVHSLDPAIKRAFSIAVLDEAHRVQSAKNRQTYALHLMEDIKTILMTATPFKNSLKDYTGLLRFVYRRVEPLMPATIPEPNGTAYAKDMFNFQQDHGCSVFGMDRDLQMKYFRFLDPKAYGKLMGGNTTDLAAEAAEIVPLPVALSMLRRVKGTKMAIGEEEILVGGSIPEWTAEVIELRRGGVEDLMYKGIMQSAKASVEELMAAADGTENKGVPGGNAKRRRLGLGTAHPSLDAFVLRKINTEAALVNKRSQEGIDSFSFFHSWTKQDLYAMTPNSRVPMGYGFVGPSVKLQMLLKLISKHWLENGEKMIIWANEPQSLWMAELLCSIFQINFVSIRSGIKPNARVSAEVEFNTNPKVGVIICSSRSCQESMNLQKGGHIQVVFDVVSFGALCQMIGRSHRLGQKYPVKVYILVVDNSYDQVAMANAFDRYRATIAAGMEVSVMKADELLKSLSSQDRSHYETMTSGEPTPTKLRDVLVKDIRPAVAEAAIRRLFGLRSNRDPQSEWTRPNFAAKNTQPTEVIHRLAMRGDIANEVTTALREEAHTDSKKEEKIPTRDPEDPLPAGARLVRITNEFESIQMTTNTAAPATHDELEGWFCDAADKISKGLAYTVCKTPASHILQQAYARYENPPPAMWSAVEKLRRLEQEKLNSAAAKAAAANPAGATSTQTEHNVTEPMDVEPTTSIAPPEPSTPSDNHPVDRMNLDGAEASIHDAIVDVQAAAEAQRQRALRASDSPLTSRSPSPSGDITSTVGRNDIEPTPPNPDDTSNAGRNDIEPPNSQEEAGLDLFLGNVRKIEGLLELATSLGVPHPPKRPSRAECEELIFLAMHRCLSVEEPNFRELQVPTIAGKKPWADIMPEVANAYETDASAYPLDEITVNGETQHIRDDGEVSDGGMSGVEE